MTAKIVMHLTSELNQEAHALVMSDTMIQEYLNVQYAISNYFLL
jgi:hypothetical protein